MINSFKKGISIVEIVIASGVITVCVVGIVGAIQIYLKIVHQNSRESQAVLLLDETSEVLQYLRDKSFSSNIESLSLNTPYTIYWDELDYQIAPTTVSLPYNMTRSIEFQSISRDALDKIDSEGGTNDEKTRKAIITISWPYLDGQREISSEILIHDTYDN